MFAIIMRLETKHRVCLWRKMINITRQNAFNTQLILVDTRFLVKIVLLMNKLQNRKILLFVYVIRIYIMTNILYLLLDILGFSISFTKVPVQNEQWLNKISHRYVYNKGPCYRDKYNIVKFILSTCSYLVCTSLNIDAIL